jgi:hypothetical protein
VTFKLITIAIAILGIFLLVAKYMNLDAIAILAGLFNSARDNIGEFLKKV